MNEATTILEHALRVAESNLSANSLVVAEVIANLGITARLQGNLPKAQDLHERALEIRRTILGAIHPDTAASSIDVAGVRHERGDAAGALELLKQAVRIQELFYSTHHPVLVRTLTNLGLVLLDLKDFSAAQSQLQRALSSGTDANLDSFYLAPIHHNLGLALFKLGEHSQAREQLECALRIDLAAYGEVHWSVASDLADLGALFLDLGDWAESRSHLERALIVAENVFGSNHPKTAAVRNSLGAALQGQGHLLEAREHYEQALAMFRRHLGDDHPPTSIALRNLHSLDN